MTHAKTAASPAETITAVHISNLSNGIGHPLSWNYTVSASSAECHAATRKWIEAFGVGVNDTRENLAGETITVTVIGSFGCRTMVPLRLLALASNVAFMTYAVRNQLTPVLMLHALLLPTNIVRLWQILATRRLAWHLPHMSQDST
ncbi:MAG: hypothetical protein J0I08_03110 [Rhizobiales bacterium]|nr:hypothetical protein [Hyphomicrobiales bacterium]